MAVLPAPSAASHRIGAWSRTAYDRWSAFASSGPALLLMFVWAVAEATVWPVIPDLLLAALSLGAGRRAWRLLIVSAAGSALGGACLYLLAWWRPAELRAFVGGLPLVTAAQVGAAGAELDRIGVLGFLRQPWSGIPFKVWAVAGAAQGISPFAAIPVSITARTLRMALVAGCVGFIGARWAGQVRAWFLSLAVAYLVVGAAVWWLVMR